MLLVLMSATAINVAINFRDYSYKSAINKANTMAEYVRDGLTVHMVNGIMPKREFFLDNIKNHKDIQDLWVIRGAKVNNQYGPGFQNEKTRDALDKEVLKTGKMKYFVNENSDKVLLRVTIPYKATAYGSPNCLECHQAHENDVLGAVSMVFDISNTRYEGIATVLKIIGINIIFLLIALFAVNYFVRPITTLFTELKKMIQYALLGDYSKRVELKLQGEGQEVVEQINNLFEKLQNTFKDLKLSLSTFVASSQITCENPLEESRKIINELSNIYKFKKTIELDNTYEDIFTRIEYILEKTFGIQNYRFYLLEKEKNEKQLILEKGDVEACNCSQIDKNALECRAYRTDSEVLSIDFENVCQYCERKNGYEYICLPFNVNEEVMLLFTFFTNDKKEYERIQYMLKDIEHYLDAAKPVLESKFLMKKLQDSSLKDGLTNLYNRRFLENFIEQFAKQADRVETSYAIMMIDIDYFKMVNDNYGHDIGDIVIKELAYILKSSIRASDMAIRYGGEEFLIFLYNSDQNKVLDIAQNISDKFKTLEFQAGNATFKKTISIGISYYPKQAESIWKTIKFADTALYVAKESGRDKIVEFEASMYTQDENY